MTIIIATGKDLKKESTLIDKNGNSIDVSGLNRKEQVALAKNQFTRITEQDAK